MACYSMYVFVEGEAETKEGIDACIDKVYFVLVKLDPQLLIV